MIFVEGLSVRKAVWGRSVECAHLISDTSLAELRAFAASIRIPEYWLQTLVVPHYELTDFWRRRALKAGAIDCAGADREARYLAALRHYVMANPCIVVPPGLRTHA